MSICSTVYWIPFEAYWSETILGSKKYITKGVFIVLFINPFSNSLLNRTRSSFGKFPYGSKNPTHSLSFVAKFLNPKYGEKSKITIQNKLENQFGGKYAENVCYLDIKDGIHQSRSAGCFRVMLEKEMF